MQGLFSTRSKALPITTDNPFKYQQKPYMERYLYMQKSSFVCPNCGALLQAGARVCPDCGSDENTGWSDGTYMDGVDLPFDDDEYEEARTREFSQDSGGKARIYVDWRMVIGVLVAAAMLLVFVFGRG